MKINFDSLMPVYLQIAEAIEDDILSGKLTEGGAAYSQLVLARELNVNPATAAKGIGALVTKDILLKQRGASMIVAAGAAERIRHERRGRTLRALVAALVGEAAKLGLSESELLAEIQAHYQETQQRQQIQGGNSHDGTR